MSIRDNLKKILASENPELAQFFIKPKKGDKGDDYILTDEDKKEIADQIEVPIVEKVIETVHEQPIIKEYTKVINEIKEKAVTDEPEIIADKLNTLKEKVSFEVLKDVPEGLTMAKVLKEIKGKLEPKDIKGMPINFNDMRWHGGGLSKVVHDATLSGDGTDADPLIVIGGGGSQTPWTSDIDGAGYKLNLIDKSPVTLTGDGTPTEAGGVYTWSGIYNGKSKYENTLFEIFCNGAGNYWVVKAKDNSAFWAQTYVAGAPVDLNGIVFPTASGTATGSWTASCVSSLKINLQATGTSSFDNLQVNNIAIEDIYSPDYTAKLRLGQREFNAINPVTGINETPIQFAVPDPTTGALAVSVGNKLLVGTSEDDTSGAPLQVTGKKMGPDDPATSGSATQVSGGTFIPRGNSYAFFVYPFKTYNGVNVYSQNYNEIDFTDDGSATASITGWELNAGGTGYVVNDTVIAQAGNTDATFNVDSVDGIPGEINANSLGDQTYATGYAVGDTVSIDGGNNDAVVTIDSVDFPPGTVTSISLASSGTSYNPNDLLTLNGGNNNCVAKVLTTDGRLGEAISVALGYGGYGYSVDDVLTLTGGSSNCTVNVDSIDGIAGEVISITPDGVGTGYTVNDVLTLTGGDNNCTVTVTSVDVITGAVTGATLTTPGAGYTTTSYAVTGGTGNNDETITVNSTYFGEVTGITMLYSGNGYTVDTFNTSGGGGLDATVSVDGIYYGNILTIELHTAGDGYTAGSEYSVTGGSGSDASIAVDYIKGGVPLTYTLTSPGTAYTTGDNNSTTSITSAGGTGFTIDIDSVYLGEILSLSLTAAGTGYDVYDYPVVVQGNYGNYDANINITSIYIGDGPYKIDVTWDTQDCDGYKVIINDPVIAPYVFSKTLTGNSFTYDGVGFSTDVIVKPFTYIEAESIHGQSDFYGDIKLHGNYLINDYQPGGSNFLGYLAGNGAYHATNALFLGTAAGQAADYASDSLFIGDSAGCLATTASNSTFIGAYSGYQATNASGSLFIGTDAGREASQANGSLFIGTTAGQGAVGAYAASFIGYGAGRGATNASFSTFIGFRTGEYATGSDGAIFIGNLTGIHATHAYGATFLGDGTGVYATDAHGALFIGKDTGAYATYANNSTFIGSTAGVLADHANGSLFIGQSAGYNARYAQTATFIGNSAGYSATYAANSIFTGLFCGYAATNAANSIFTGSSAGYGATNANYSLFIGDYAGYNDTVNNSGSGAKTSIAIGARSGTGGYSDSIAIGHAVKNDDVNQLNIGNVLKASGLYSGTNTQSATLISTSKVTVAKLAAMNLPTGTLVSPPSGLSIGDMWADTTTSSQYPIIRVRAS